jgi:hypothetical protein
MPQENIPRLPLRRTPEEMQALLARRKAFHEAALAMQAAQLKAAQEATERKKGFFARLFSR